MDRNAILSKFISTQGYKNNSPDKNRAFNIIPSNQITMSNVDFPIKGVDNLGNEQIMYPGEDYVFPGEYVIETPMMQSGGKIVYVDSEDDKAYQDCLTLYNKANERREKVINIMLDDNNQVLLDRTKTITYDEWRNGTGSYYGFTQNYFDYNPNAKIKPSRMLVDKRGFALAEIYDKPVGNKWKGYPDWNNYSSTVRRNNQASGSTAGTRVIVTDKSGKEYPMNESDYYEYNKYLQSTRNKKQEGGNIGWLDNYQVGGEKMSKFAKDMFGYDYIPPQKTLFREPTMANDNAVAAPLKDFQFVSHEKDGLQKLNPYNWGVSDYTDKGEFDKAYFAARKNGEKEFMWNNKRFNTNYDGTPQQQLKETGITDERMQGQNIIKEQIYNNLQPRGYEKPFERIYDALIGTNSNVVDKPHREDAWALYMGRPQQHNTFSVSKYSPSKKSKDNVIYYTINKINNKNFEESLLKRDIDKPYTPDNDYNDVMGNFKIDKGEDEHGKYISYYDIWDLNPFELKNPITKKEITTDIGKPFEIYNRVYYRENPDTNKYAEYDKKIEDLWDLARKTQDKKYLDEVDELYRIRNSYYDKQSKYIKQYYSDKELLELDANKKNFDTLALQRELSNRGYELPKSTKKDGSFDGTWGDETEQALLDIQSKLKDKKQEGGALEEYAYNPVPTTDEEQIYFAIAEKLQNGETPETIVQQLIQSGIPQEQAIQVVQQVIQQMQGAQQETQNLPQAAYGMEYNTDYRKLSNLNYDISKNNTIGQNIDAGVNSAALASTLVGDPRSFLWAAPDKGVMGKIKAATGIAGLLGGAYLGYRKLFSDPKTSLTDKSRDMVGDKLRDSLKPPQYQTTPTQNLINPYKVKTFEEKYYDDRKEYLNVTTQPKPNTGVEITTTGGNDNQYMWSPTNVRTIPKTNNNLSSTKNLNPVSDRDMYAQWAQKQLDKKNSLSPESNQNNPKPNNLWENEHPIEYYWKKCGGQLPKAQYGDFKWGSTGEQYTYPGYDMYQINSELIPEYSYPTSDKSSRKFVPLSTPYEGYSRGSGMFGAENFEQSLNNMPILNPTFTRPDAPERMQVRSPEQINLTYDSYNAFDDYKNRKNVGKVKIKERKDPEYIVGRGDREGLIAATNAINAGAMANQALSAEDYAKQYRAMMMFSGNTDQRYLADNPVDPRGMYTLNAAVYRPDKQAHTQDFGTDTFNAKRGGMVYEAGKEYELSEEQIEELRKLGYEFE